jgi:hypothetical protein
MKSYIFCDNFTNIDWNNSEYRTIVLTGRTMSETELRAWFARTYKFITFTQEPTIAELANIISGSGYSLFEKL